MFQAFLASPEWFGAAILGALIAALTYASTVLINSITNFIETRRQRRAELVRLQALLRTARVSYLVQQEKADTLCASISQRIQIPSGRGREEAISKNFLSLTDDERELHGIIRAMTEHMLRPTNEALLDWVRKDTFYKTQRREGLHRDLAQNLAWLEIHLLMWLAKYEVWIPPHPHHALVYLYDEKEHGIEFPHGLDLVVNRLIGWSPAGDLADTTMIAFSSPLELSERGG